MGNANIKTSTQAALPTSLTIILLGECRRNLACTIDFLVKSNSANPPPSNYVNKWIAMRETGDKFTKRHSFTHCFTSEHNILVINISHRQSLPVLIRTISLADIAIVVLSPSYSALSDTHYLAASALGLKHILFAIDEMESVDFSEEEFNKFCDAVRKKYPNAKFVPISSTRSENIINTSKLMAWWKGLSLLETVLAFSKEIEEDRIVLRSQPFRFAIYFPMTIKGVGAVALGKVISGSAATNSYVYISRFYEGWQSGTSATGATLSNIGVKTAKVGDVLEFNLPCYKAKDLPIGGVLRTQSHKVTKCEIMVKAVIEVVGLAIVFLLILQANVIRGLSEGFEAFYISHCTSVNCQVATILDKRDDKGNVIELRPRKLLNGERGLVRIKFSKAVEIETDNELMSKFVVLQNQDVAFSGIVTSVIKVTSNTTVTWQQKANEYPKQVVKITSYDGLENYGILPLDILKSILRMLPPLHYQRLALISRGFYHLIYSDDLYWSRGLARANIAFSGPPRIAVLAWYSVSNKSVRSRKKHKKFLKYLCLGRKDQIAQFLQKGLDISDLNIPDTLLTDSRIRQLIELYK